ncbi:MAG: flagellar hook-associated protein FlgK [Acidobacteriota bacterium]|jgi:flagellar hook-associated protein 1 FlgK|nr:flagellar hook-associated protein FlgK [Acidobacteriota bacterium]
MASILDGLNTVKQSLAVQQFALSVTQRNTANVNNPNYSRQDLVFTDPTVASSWALGGTPGVDVRASRNSFLDHSISRELPELGENEVKYSALQEIDAIMQGTSGAGLGETLANFFNSFTELSGNPTDMNLRLQTISQAELVATDFNRLYGDIQQVQSSANQHVKSGIDEVNTLTTRIADLNGRIEAAHARGSVEEASLRDERQQYLDELENKMGVRYFETEAGTVTVTTDKGDALVLGDTSWNLEIGPLSGSSFYGISLNGKDVTDSVSSGEIGGYLQVRDALIPGYLATLDDMAAGIIERVNDVHALGVDLDGNAGGDFFTPFTQLTPGSNTGAARAMEVAISDPRAVAAAASGGDVGDNTNAKALAAISGEKLFAGGTQTASESYAALLYRVGSDERDAEDAVTLQTSVIDQLKDQRDAASGVDLNEEAVNLIKFQQAYQASSRFATVLNALSEEILNIIS